tara:strand:+ start:4037 stop:4282 length:246 start_codon:yes stop_codon:yes gene_type:complete
MNKGDKVMFKPVKNKISYASDYHTMSGILEYDEYEGVINRVYKNSYSITYESPKEINSKTNGYLGKPYLNINVLKENVSSK